MNNVATGRLLAALRKEKGLPQSKAAEILKISPKTVSKWECGDALPEIMMLVTIADFYGVTVDVSLACLAATLALFIAKRSRKAIL